MDTKRLNAFAKVVDIGSITRAATVLNIAQPALSQQIAALETHFGKPLLVRSKRGVVPTEAGKILYRHCQTVQKQLDQAMLDIRSAGEALSGAVTVVFAPLSLGAALGARLLLEVQRRHPGIVLHLHDAASVGGIISEQIMAGKADMALIFDPGPLPGLAMTPIQSEELYLVTAQAREGAEAEAEGGEAILLEAALSEPLILPHKLHTVRKVIDTALSRAGRQAEIIAVTDSIAILSGALIEGHAASIVPRSAAIALVRRLPQLRMYRVRKPNMTVNMVVCVSAQLPMSEPAVAVQKILLQLAEDPAGHAAPEGAACDPDWAAGAT